VEFINGGAANFNLKRKEGRIIGLEEEVGMVAGAYGYSYHLSGMAERRNPAAFFLNTSRRSMRPKEVENEK